MLKSFINKALKAALSELFLNANEGVSLSMGSDLFTDSNLNLKNLIIRPDIFDILLQPLRLVSGQISSLKLEGIAEMAFGGKLRLNVENVFLLFQVDEEIDAERSQILKKILIEYTSSNGSLPQLLLREILKKVQGYPAKPSSTNAKDEGIGGDAKKQRRLLIKGLNYAFTNISVFVRTVHIRFEIPGKGRSCSAFGWTIPQIKIIPYNPTQSPKSVRSSQTHPGVDINGSTPQVSIFFKSLQMYCDYDTTSYCISTAKQPQFHDFILQEFKQRWTSESHTAMLLPIDLEITIAVEVRKRTGLTSFKVATNISSLRMACDIKQLEIMCEFFDRYISATKRSMNQLRVRGIFGKKFPPPFISEVGGVTILPHLLVNSKQYPQLGSIPRASQGNGSIILLLKSRLGPNWGKAIWRFAYRMVVDDVRRQKPYYRWIELIKLCWTRKQYAFLYSRLLRRSKETGNFLTNVQAKIDIQYGLKIFEYEMILPPATIKLFRGLAMMICFVELMNSKRKQAVKTGDTSNAWYKLQIPWKALIFIHSCIIECQRRSVFEKSERLSPEDDSMTDTITEVNTDDGHEDSSRSFFNHRSSGGSGPPSSNTVISTGGTQTMGGKVSMYGTARAVASMQSSAMKMFGSAFSSATSSSATSQDDEGAGNKFLSRADLLAFADWFALFESESSSQESVTLVSSNTATPVNSATSSNTSTTLKPRPLNLPSHPSSSNLSESSITTEASASNHSHGVVAPVQASDILSLKDTRYEIWDWQLGGKLPSTERINESVQLILQKDQNVLTIIPPDISFRFGCIEWNVRYPLDKEPSRKILSSMIFREVSLNLIITYGTTSPTSPVFSSSTTQLRSKNKKLDENQLRALPMILPIMGSLIQLRCTVVAFEWSLYAYNKKLVKVLNGDEIDHEGKLMRNKKLLRSFGVKVEAPAIEEEIEKQPINVTDEEESDHREYDEDSGDEDDDENRLSATNNGWDDLLSKYQPPEEIAVASNPIALSTDEALNISATSTLSSYMEVVKIFQSKSNDRFLVLCILLDFDYKGEGAADVQLHVGEGSVDVSANTIASLVDEQSIENFYRMMSLLRSISGLLHERTMPYHLREDALTKTTTSLEERVVSREKVLELLNTAHYRSILDYVMPKVVTVSFRSSKIQADFLSASLIRNFIFATFQDIADHASANKDRTLDEYHSPSRRSDDHFPSSIAFLEDIGRKVSRSADDDASRRPFRADRCVFSISPIEVNINKVTSPSQVDIRGMGMELLIPMDDDTLCLAMSLLLGKYFPVYT